MNLSLNNCRSWMKILSTSSLALLLMVLVAGVSVAQELPLTFNPAIEADRNMFEPLFGAPFNPGIDPDGELVFHIGTDLATVPGDTYKLRYVIIKTDDLENPTIEFEARGGAQDSGNPSHFVIFGWQDYKNFYYSYPAESTATRIARVVDGVHETLYNHGAIIWRRNREEYQSIKLEVKTVDGQSVVDTYINGELAMSYTFEEDKAPPAGRVGLAMWNDYRHTAYFRNITLK